MTSRASVLVVDDDHSVRSLLLTLVKREGLQADAAASGNQAIALLRENDYQAIVLDLMMPDGNGEDVLRILGEKSGVGNRVVVISAGSIVALDNLAHPNVHRKLHKPFDIRDLIAAVRECVTRNEPARS